MVSCLQRASLIPGGGKCIIYETVIGSVGAMFPFTSRDDVELFSYLEMYLRKEFPPLCGRDHMAYKSAYFLVKSAKDNSGSDTEDEDTDIDGKPQQAEGDNNDSNHLEEDNQTEVNYDEEANIAKKILLNFISPTSIGPATSANDISNPKKKEK
ncbi:hypothetical protein T459_21609 [Capsicum annuum]|uniref:RSE1/DDB1/CPSF1 C-terminal domain-containing protein n=1 Tax=Capsicum annuum TaxID=4072 RepID=A0A2G2YX44_CAPAN|nr:hypothetical protein T459_21609 [Capsicum annuum]